MIALNEISQVGFGCYRMSEQHPDHYAALSHALDSGCNFIDTSSTYNKGGSESLIGRVLSDKGMRQRVYLVSKAGYVSKFVKEAFAEAPQSELREHILHHDHSIDPLYLDWQLAGSLERLQTDRIDAYLLHNPEYLMTREGSEVDEDGFYQAIRSAFAYLESQVAAGRLRHYGISCNTLPLAPREAHPVWLRKLLEIAEEVSPNHHFRWLQFPFNLVEDEAASLVHQEGQSLIELARKHGLRTVGNRPLNAQLEKGWVRLANYDTALENLVSVEEGDAVLEELYDLVQARLDEVAPGEDLRSLPGIVQIGQTWHSTLHDGTLRKLFEGWLGQLLDYIYEGEIPGEVLQLSRQAHDNAQLYSKKWMNEKFKAFVKERGLEDLLHPGGEGTTPSARLVARYLHQGPDHVLLGMRQTRYVDEVAHLFGPATATLF